MKKYFFILLLILPLVGFSQKKGPKKKSEKKSEKKGQKCDSITCDYVVTMYVDYTDSVSAGVSRDTMIILLYDKAPKHKANFIKLAQEGFFNGTTFHRVIPGFMIQGGDPNSKDDNPNNDGQGSPGYMIPAEFDPALKHKRGAIAAARMGDQVNPNRESNGSQFYIVQSNTGAAHLDGSYTVFGEVVKGQSAIDRVAKQPTNRYNNRPLSDVKMTVKVEQISKKKITELYGYQY